MNKWPREITEDQRPGLTKLCEQLRELYPHWDTARVQAHAKNQWHLRNPGPLTRGQAGAA